MTGPLVLTLLLAGPLASDQQKVNRASATLADFGRRVNEYVKVRKAVESQVHILKPTNSPEEIQQHERELAQGIRQARRDARQGGIFTPEIAAEFRRLIAEAMRGPEAARIRESLRSGSPVAAQAISVNASYPPAAPLQSTPPSLLGNLPELPPGLDYRLVGRSLILRDVEANMILDFISNVIS
jgi:hypothetical protein